MSNTALPNRPYSISVFLVTAGSAMGHKRVGFPASA